MDPRWSPTPKDSARRFSVIRHPTATFVDIITGVATDGIDLTQYMTTGSHTSKDANIKLVYHTQLDSTNQPRPGELIEIQLNGQTLWVGIIDSIENYTFETGAHSLTLKVYSRENTPTWKSIKRVTNLYASGTPVSQIATDIADSVSLSPLEIALPLSSVYIVHSNMQLANMSAWDMLGAVLLSSGYDPFIDARGIVKGISRDLARSPDVVLTKDRVIAITGSMAKSPITSVRILWLDPALSEVVHQDQALAQATITAGFFQLHQNLDVFFSQDRTQRASGTYMVVKQSANSGLIPFCSEKYVQFSPTNGQIQLTTSIFAPLLATDALAGLIAASFIPDDVTTAGFVVNEGITIPVGRRVEMIAQVAILLIMMSMGTGVYEIRGTPYDLVNARNRTEATAKGVPDWLLQSNDIENDFVMNEAHAQAFAARELIYLSRAVTGYNARIADDPRIEPGDIVQLYDGSRLYVTDYKRTLTYGSKAELDLVGFQASPPSATLPVPVPGPSPSPPSPGSPPPGALALGYTKLLWRIVPTVADVSFNNLTTKSLYAVNFPFAAYSPSYLTDTAGHLTLNNLGDGVTPWFSTQRSNATAGLLTYLNASTGFYVHGKFRMSDNDIDHFPGWFFVPKQHTPSIATDQLPGAPAGYQGWMEVDMWEAGFFSSPMQTVINWNGYYNQAFTFTVPPTGTSGIVTSWPGLTDTDFFVTFSDGQIKQVALTQGSGHTATWSGALTGTPTVNARNFRWGRHLYSTFGTLSVVDYTTQQDFGASLDPIGKMLQYYVNDVATFNKDISGFPARFLTDNYYAIVDAASHGGNVPYTLFVDLLEAWGPP
jgi:hypothetical protein